MNGAQIVVLGMHRSGTSAIIRLLKSAGCYLGKEDDFLPDNEANLKGYWERVDIVSLNKILLEGCGLDWMSAHRFDPADVPEATIMEFRKGADQIVTSLDSRGTWAIKDPRMCITLPMWQSLLKAPIYVLCLRHPIEVAMSLKSRNNIPISVGCALWEAYTKAMLANTIGARRVLVSYTRLLKYPAKESARLVKGLNEAGARLPPTDELQLSSFVDVGLHRQHLNAGLIGASTSEQLALFNQLEDNIVPDISTLQLQIGTARDLLELYNANRALSERLKYEAGEFKEQINRLIAQRDEREKKINVYKEQIKFYKEQVNRLIAQRDVREEKIKYFEARLPELKALVHSKQRESAQLMERILEVQKFLMVAGSKNNRNIAVGSAKSIIEEIINSVVQDRKHDS